MYACDYVSIRCNICNDLFSRKKFRIHQCHIKNSVLDFEESDIDELKLPEAKDQLSAVKKESNIEISNSEIDILEKDKDHD